MRCANNLPAIAVAAALALAGAQARALAPVTIELRPSVQVTSAQVRLGDIAYLTTRDLPTLRRLMALPLGAAPRPGSPALLEREALERWVLARSGLQASADVDGTSPLYWTGAAETSIEIATQELPGDAVAQAAQSALTQWLSQRSVRAQVQPLSLTRDLTLPAGTPVLRVRPLAASATPQRRMLVWVDVWVDERFVRTLAVRFDVDAWAPVTVATDRLDSGAAVDAVTLRGATESREVNLATLRSGTHVKTADTVQPDQRLRQPLRPGEVLTDAHLEPTPAVTRGNWARLLARSGEVTVESRVEVLQDGRTGQVVRVKVPGGSGEVLARVTGRGQVEVQP